ncbi:MAG: MarR family transcriptional regulator [Sphingobium sp.]|nr:MarR family transcriptional regulator [Sphingobium sp.]
MTLTGGIASGRQDTDWDPGLTLTPIREAVENPLPVIERDDRPTLLVVASEARASELNGWAVRAGFRSLGMIEPCHAAQRLAVTIAVDLIVVDLRDAHLDPENARALAMRHGLPDAHIAVIADLAGLDCALSQFDGPASEFLCEPSSNDVANLLLKAALQAERRRCDPQLHDSGRESEIGRIEQLSEEVRRLATMVERLAQPGEAHGHAMPAAEPPAPYGMGMTSADQTAEQLPPRSDTCSANALLTQGEIKALLRARRLREQFLPADLFADPAWDMILDLMAARLAGQRVSVSSLCIAAAVPPTTALRWIRQLTDRGVFSRIDDPADGRRVFIALTDSAADAVMAWSAAVRRTGGLLPPA